MRKVALLLFILLSNAHAVEPTKVEGDISVTKRIKNYFSEVYFYGSGYLGANSEDYIGDSGKENLLLGVGVSLPIYSNFSFGLALRSGVDHDKKVETARDIDIYDAHNEKHRLVERSLETKFEEDGLMTLMLEYRHASSTGSRLVSYLGYGRSAGKISYNEFTMTDRKHWALFSTHNRYNLTSITPFNTETVQLGVRYHLKTRYVFTGEISRTAYQLEKTTRNLGVNGEDFDFKSDAYAFEAINEQSKLNDNYQVLVGIGLYF